MKKSLKEKVAELPTHAEMLKADLKDPEFAAAYRRARLRVAVARAVKAARERAKMTQAALALAVGVPQPQIGRLESLKSKTLPTLDLLVRISQATGKTIAVDDEALHLELAAK